MELRNLSLQKRFWRKDANDHHLAISCLENYCINTDADFRSSVSPPPIPLLYSTTTSYVIEWKTYIDVAHEKRKWPGNDGQLTSEKCPPIASYSDPAVRAPSSQRTPYFGIFVKETVSQVGDIKREKLRGKKWTRTRRKLERYHAPKLQQIRSHYIDSEANQRGRGKKIERKVTVRGRIPSCHPPFLSYAFKDREILKVVIKDEQES